ncbi:PcfJ domain-containing protein [Amorphus sp. 3PC139-8]|uniref:PcfJ domain-containing protein n=1 Tax=Amorphus sp. 3PC139-8 TaxID=2735676 RepID=UPI00345D7304
MKISELITGDPSIVHLRDELRNREGFVFLSSSPQGLRGRCVTVEPDGVPFLQFVLVPALMGAANPNRHYLASIAAAVLTDLVDEQELIDGSPRAQLDQWTEFLESRDPSAAPGGNSSGLYNEILSRQLEEDFPFFVSVDTGLKVRRDLTFVSTPIDIGETLSLFRRHAAHNVLTSIRYGEEVKVVDSPRVISELVDRVVEANFEAGLAALRGAIEKEHYTLAWYAAKGDVGDARRQAAEAYPVLAHHMAESAELRRVIDEARPLQIALTKSTGLSKGALKRLAKVSAPGVEKEQGGPPPAQAAGEDAVGVNRVRRFTARDRLSTADAVRLLRDLPPDWVPDCNEQWTAFCEVASAVIRPIELLGHFRGADLLASAKGNWREYRTSLARSADLDPESVTHRQLALTASDAINVADQLSTQVVLPTALAAVRSVNGALPSARRSDAERARGVALDIILGGAKNGPGAMFTVARRWMTRTGRLDEIQRQEDGNATGSPLLDRYGPDAWPALALSFTASNGLVVRCLTNTAELRQESARLGHCVGAATGRYRDHYVNSARRGDCHILSVQSGDLATSYSTIELVPRSSGAMTLPSVRQHRGRRNSEPSQASKDAFDEWRQAVQDGRLSLNWDLCATWKVEMQEQRQGEANDVNGWIPLLGWDPSDETRRLAFWGEWKGLLGGSWNKSDDPGILFRNAGMRDLVREISPSAAERLEAQAAARRMAPADEAGPAEPIAR